MCQFPSCLKVWTGLSLTYVHVGAYKRLQDLDPPVQPEKAFMHILSHSFDLKLFTEDLRTNAELFMSFLSWPRANWELEGPQLRTWPTAMSRGPGCCSITCWDPEVISCSSQHSLLASFSPSKGFRWPCSPLGRVNLCQPLTYLREKSYCFTSHASHLRPTIFTLVTPFLETEGFSAQGSLSLILFKEGGKESETSVLFVLGRAV